MQLQDINPDMEKLTIVMPVRIDSEERKSNLRTVLNHLSELKCRIIVLEADAEPILKSEGWVHIAEYKFVKDTSSVFHRTQYINKLLHISETEIVAVWDTDVLVSYSQITDACRKIQEGYTVVYPYNGQFIMLTEQMSNDVRKKFDITYLQNQRLKSFLGRKLCGGAFLVHRQRYLQCGGENERFTGWGPEDAERLRRVQILGHRVSWCNQYPLYHLYHPRGSNSSYQSEEDATTLRFEFVKICSMDSEELQSYIQDMNTTYKTQL